MEVLLGVDPLAGTSVTGLVLGGVGILALAAAVGTTVVTVARS